MSKDLCQHYYLRNEDNVPFACVAITPTGMHEADDTICRGISICSDREQWDKKAARGRAIQRALKAKRSNQSSEQCFNAQHESVSRFLHLFGDEFRTDIPWDDGVKVRDEERVSTVFKSACSVEPTKREQKILTFLKERLSKDTASV
jgi:hypothetical protein